MSTAARHGLAIGLLGLIAACSERVSVAPSDSTVAPEADATVTAMCNRAAVPVVDALQCTPIVVTDDELPPDVPDAARCEPGRALPCRCADGDAGIVPCSFQGYRSECFCDPPGPTPLPDGGTPTPPPHPPRLVAPLSGMRVTSRRPTLRWASPVGVQRARVELCDDRACTRRVTQTEVSGTSWRPAEVLRPGVLFWRVTGLRADGTSAWTSATWEFGVRHRDTPTDSASGPIRDVNGDAVDDVVLNSAFESVLIPGGTNGIPVTPVSVVYQRRQYLLPNETIGDVNGDGLTDMVVALKRSGLGPGTPSVRLFWGAPGCPFQRNARVEGILENPVAGFGSDVAICDFNGDGFGDLMVTSSSEATLYLGRVGPLRWQDRASWGDGYFPDVVGVGDVDGDGYGDVILRGRYRPTDPSEIRILFGNPRGLIDERVQSLTSQAPNDRSVRLMVADDYSGDGRTDVAVSRGLVVDLYWGESSGLRFNRTLSIPGRSQPGIGPNFGDLDGDGRSELLVSEGIVYSSSLSNSSSSVVQFLYARGELSMQDPQFFGYGVAGDLNGDGFDDFLGYGNYFADSGTDAGGRVHVESLALHLGGGTALCRPVRMWDLSPVLWSLPHF